MGMGQDILVIKKEILFKDGPFIGYVPSSAKDYISLILNNYEYKKRTPQLENNPQWQQPIPYVWLVNSITKEVFIYKRDITGDEGRLYNKYSGGVGGHIDKDTEEKTLNPILSAMMRELKEEVVMKNYPGPEIKGFLSLNYGVHAVHFGIVAIAETTEEVKPAEGMMHGKFCSIQEAEKIIDDPTHNVEEWTKISWPYIKEYLLNN